MVNISFKMRITNGFRYQKTELNGILEYLKYALPNLSEDDLFDLRVIYSEVIVNAIVHGHNKDFTKYLELSIKIEDNTIKTIVKDEGCGFDYLHILGSPEPEGNVFDEHGRGLQLVIGLADHVEWNSTGNAIMIHKNFRPVQ